METVVAGNGTGLVIVARCSLAWLLERVVICNSLLRWEGKFVVGKQSILVRGHWINSKKLSELMRIINKIVL